MYLFQQFLYQKGPELILKIGFERNVLHLMLERYLEDNSLVLDFSKIWVRLEVCDYAALIHEATIFILLWLEDWLVGLIVGLHEKKNAVQIAPCQLFLHLLDHHAGLDDVSVFVDDIDLLLGE